MKLTREHALSTLLWSAAQSWGGKAITFAIFVTLARLLQPEDFGIASASVLVLMLVGLISECGFGDALIQRPSMQEKEVNLPFFIALAASSGLAVTVYICADEIASLLGVVGLGEVLKVTCFLAPLSAVLLFQEAMYRRHLSYKVLAIRAIAANFIAGGVAVIAALNGLGVWSLVIQGYLVVITGLVWLWRRPVWRPSFQFDSESTRQLSFFGASILASRLLDFATTRVVDLIILTKFGVAALGLYSVGSRLYLTALELLQGALSNAALSLLSRVSADRNKLAAAYMQSSAMLAVLVSPIFVASAALSPEIAAVLLGQRWGDAAIVMQPLLLLGSVQCVQFMNGPYLASMGRPHLILMLNLIKACSVLGGLLFLTIRNIEDAVLFFVLLQLVVTPFSFGIVVRHLRLSVLELLKRFAPPFLSAWIAMLLVHMCRPLLAEVHQDIGRGFLLLLVFLGTYACLLSVVSRREVGTLVRQLLRDIRVRGAAT